MNKFVIQLIDALVWPLVLTLCMWLVFFMDHGYHWHLNDYGLQPLSWSGLIGVISMPFLHADFDHLFSNSVPLLLSMGFIFLYFQQEKWKIILWIYVLSGILLWFIGQPFSNHIGASGLVYGFIAFLITHAFINRNKQTIAASFVLVFLYGSLVYGIFPDYGRLIGKNISWEGHLSGAIFGVLMGIIYRNKGPQKTLYFEDEDEDEDDEDDYWIERSEDGTTYIYHYKQQE